METGVRSLTSTDLNVTTTSSTETLGAVGVTADGRKFRYVSTDAVAGLGQGLLGISPAPIADHTNLSLNANSAEAVGSSVVTVDIGATACVTDQYAGGYLIVRDGAGAGAAYRINGNTQSAGNGPVQVTLFDELSTALDTATTTVDLINPYSGVLADTTSSAAVGVAQVDFAAGAYGWVQTSGYASVYCEGGWTSGQPVGQSLGFAGGVSQGGNPSIGNALDASLDTEHGPVQLNIA